MGFSWIFHEINHPFKIPPFTKSPGECVEPWPLFLAAGTCNSSSLEPTVISLPAERTQRTGNRSWHWKIINPDVQDGHQNKHTQISGRSKKKTASGKTVNFSEKTRKHNQCFTRNVGENISLHPGNQGIHMQSNRKQVHQSLILEAQEATHWPGDQQWRVGFLRGSKLGQLPFLDQVGGFSTPLNRSAPRFMVVLVW